MKVSSPRALVLSLAGGLAIGLIGGSLYAVVFGKVWIYGVGTVLFLVGLIVLVMGLLGALEPREGWATGKGTQAEDRAQRSLAARVTQEHPDLEPASPLSLAVWGTVVGFPLLALAALAFYLAA